MTSSWLFWLQLKTSEAQRGSGRSDDRRVETCWCHRLDLWTYSGREHKLRVKQTHHDLWAQNDTWMMEPHQQSTNYESKLPKFKRSAAGVGMNPFLAEGVWIYQFAFVVSLWLTPVRPIAGASGLRSVNLIGSGQEVEDLQHGVGVGVLTGVHVGRWGRRLFPHDLEATQLVL